MSFIFKDMPHIPRMKNTNFVARQLKEDVIRQIAVGPMQGEIVCYKMAVRCDRIGYEYTESAFRILRRYLTLLGFKNVEYIKSKRREDYPGGQLCYTVSEETALKAVEMARAENETSAKNTGIFGQQGWICPKCGRVYSPFTSMCSFCSNGSNFNITCLGK